MQAHIFPKLVWMQGFTHKKKDEGFVPGVRVGVVDCVLWGGVAREKSLGLWNDAI